MWSSAPTAMDDGAEGELGCGTLLGDTFSQLLDLFADSFESVLLGSAFIGQIAKDDHVDAAIETGKKNSDYGHTQYFQQVFCICGLPHNQKEDNSKSGDCD